MGDMQELIERLENLDGPDRGVDLAIAQALAQPWSYVGEPPNSIKCARCTASLDATVGLVERMLPAWLWSVDGDGSASLLEKGEMKAHGIAKTPAIALLICLFRSLPRPGDAT